MWVRVTVALSWLALVESVELVTSAELMRSGKALGPTLEAPLWGRTAAHKGCASYCARHSSGGGYGGAIFMQHTRKAGGTMLRHYLAGYRCNLTKGHRGSSWSPKVGTSRVVVQEQLAFNAAALAVEPHALYITCLRDPVERIVSLYFFSGKWKQNDMRRLNSTARSLDQWMRDTAEVSRRRGESYLKSYAKDGAWPVRTRIWEEVSDYYTQIFSGIAAHPATEAHYVAARTTLESFDVILILETLKTERGRSQAEHLLRRVLPNAPAERCATSLPAQPVNRGRVRKNEEGKEDGLHPDDIAKIAAVNVWDAKLYADAVRLSEAQLAAPAPPECPNPSTVNCTVNAHEEIPNLLTGENIMRGCGRIHRGCDDRRPRGGGGVAGKPLASAVPSSTVTHGARKGRRVSMPRLKRKSQPDDPDSAGTSDLGDRRDARRASHD